MHSLNNHWLTHNHSAKSSDYLSVIVCCCCMLVKCAMLDSWWRLLDVTSKFRLIIALLFTRYLYHYRYHCCHHFLRRTYLLKFSSAQLRLWAVKFFVVFICFFLYIEYHILSVSWSFTFLRLLHWPKVYTHCKRIVAGASQKFTVNGNKKNKKLPISVWRNSVLDILIGFDVILWQWPGA